MFRPGRMDHHGQDRAQQLCFLGYLPHVFGVVSIQAVELKIFSVIFVDVLNFSEG